MQHLAPAEPEKAGAPDEITDLMAGAGATILLNHFQELGPYSARHLAVEIFASMQRMSAGQPAGKADA